MKLAKRLYTSEIEEEKVLKKALRRLSKNKKVENYYVIYFNNKSNLPFEIIESSELAKVYYQEQELVIVGLAYDEEEAYQLLTRIVGDMVINKKDFAERRFFLA